MLLYKNLFIAVFYSSIYSILFSGCYSRHQKTQDTTEPDAAVVYFDKNIDIAALNEKISKFVPDSTLAGAFYRSNNYSTLWINGGLDIGLIKDALAILEQNSTHGLPSGLFRQTEIKNIVDSIERKNYLDNDYLDALTRLEIFLTEATINYSAIIHYGYLNPKDLFPLDYHIEIKRPDSIFYNDVVYASLMASPISLLIDIQPKDKVYHRMQQDILKWEQYKDYTFVPIKEKKSKQNYKIGERDSAISYIAQRLALTGDYILPDTLTEIFSDELLIAVNNFRRINGFPEEEEIGKLTIDALNKPIMHYYNKTIANLERYRWKRLKNRDNGKNIEVNVAGAYLIAIGDNVPLKMNVCVGQFKTRTPLLQSDISYLNLNPVWNVPTSISQGEICLKMKRDSTYIQRQNMRIYSNGTEVDPTTIDWKNINCNRFYYTIKQDPGNGNSLGRIKFMFNNKFSVYLHDTPSKSTFKRKNRAVSHGCVRVENPVELAFFCTSAKDPVYKDRLRYSIDKSPQTTEGKALLKKDGLTKLQDIINLKQKIPVSIDYFTIYMLPGDESLYYADDVYGFDKEIVKRLNLE